jgi:ATP-dependent RNA helicase DHX29
MNISGKTTQVPQYIVEDALRQRRGPCRVICTQPRRLSAISIAKRVSKEMLDPEDRMGTREALVGYQVRLDSKVSATSALIYCTTVSLDIVYVYGLLIYFIGHLTA